MANLIDVNNFDECKIFWLKYVFANAVNDNKIGIPLYNMSGANLSNRDLQHFYRVYEAICNRVFDDDGALDTDFEYFASLVYSNEADGEKNGGQEIKFSAGEIARFLAEACSEAEIYWDNISHYVTEIEEFVNTIFGRALYDADCFSVPKKYDKNQYSWSSYNDEDAETTVDGDENTADQAQDSAQTATIAKTRQTNAVKSNKFRNLRPLSDKLRDLVGQPFDPQKFSTVFEVIDTSRTTKKGHPLFYVRPLISDTKGAGPNGTNELFYGTPSNYGWLKIYFKDQQLANDFANRMTIALNKVASQNNQVEHKLQVVQKHAHNHGYYEINTTDGRVFVKAYDINEAIASLTEEVEEYNDTKYIKFKRGTKEFDDELAEFFKKYNNYMNG